MKNQLFYNPSGNCHLGRFTLSYVGCIIVALVLGFAYSITTLFLPVIYLNLLICLGFSTVLGITCRAFIRFSHNRNKRKKIIQAIAIGLLANYFQWTVFILFAYNGVIPTFPEYLDNLSWIILPENFFTAIIDINEFGLWSVFGIQFHGIELALIWLAEAFLIMSGPIIAVLTTKPYPFSERENQWYPKFTLVFNFESISAKQHMLDALVLNPVNSIRNLGFGSGTRYSKVHLYYLPNENKQYLSIEKVNVPGRGKGKKNIEYVVLNFAIKNQDAITIMNEFDYEKEKLSII